MKGDIEDERGREEMERGVGETAITEGVTVRREGETE